MPHLVRVGQQPHVEELRIVWLQALDGCDVGLILLTVGGRCGTCREAPSRRPWPSVGGEGREPGKAEPRLVPQEDQVRLDRQALFHHAARVVHVAVERAVRQVDQLDAVELALRPEIEKGLLDGAERHRSVHRVFGERERLDVVRLRARQHEAVMVRLVAVAVDDDDVARRAESHDHDLVGRRGAVRGQVAALGAEGPCRELLHRLDVAGRLQQAVEAAGRRRGLGQEDVGPVELAHVADPLRVEDRLAAGDGQGMEGPDGPLGVVEQVGKVRRPVAVVDAVHDAEVDLERLLHVEEDAPDRGRLLARRERLNGPVRDEVDVELGAEVLDQRRELRAEAPALRSEALTIEVCVTGQVIAQERRIVPRREGEPIVDDDRLDALH